MTTSSNKTAGASRAGQARHRALQALLLDRQRELQIVLQRRVRPIPSGGPAGGVDDTEQAEAHVQEDIEVALIQMKSEALRRVRDALVRLESGDYGNCVDCGGEIAERRLRAMPFAIRCTACEDAQEQVRAGERRSEARQRFSTAWGGQVAF
jgi:DnaK suppressor protein